MQNLGERGAQSVVMPSARQELGQAGHDGLGFGGIVKPYVGPAGRRAPLSDAETRIIEHKRTERREDVEAQVRIDWKILEHAADPVEPRRTFVGKG